MHLFATASLKNRALIALVTIVAALFGFISLSGLKQELTPSVQFPAIAVISAYPGASPEVINEDVSTLIETAVRGVPSIERTSSTSTTGASMVLVEFTYGIDITATELKVERAISRISDLLPPDVDPQVVSGSIDDFPVIQIAVNTNNGANIDETAKLVETIAIPKLEELEGVRQAQLDGASGNRITITPDETKLTDAGYSEQSIRDALSQNGVLLPAGQITEGEQTLSVQVGDGLESVEALAALPLVPTPDAFVPELPETPEPPAGFEGALGAEAGAEAMVQTGPAQTEPAQTDSAELTSPEVLTIGDVATVAEEPNPTASISRINGESAVTIGVTKLSAANTVDVSHVVQDLLPELETALGDVTLTVVFDQAPYIEESVETLAVEGLLGLVFAVLVILVFLLSVRATLVTAISIPTSVLLTFIGLSFADYTLNLLTLGALTISIGRVVDDSIVVVENIKRHLKDDADKREIIVRAVREVAGAITASTITTIAVFLPMAFVSGLVGELFRPFAYTIGVALAASLVVSLTIVPVLAYWFLQPDRDKRALTTTKAPSETTAPTEIAAPLETVAPSNTAAHAEPPEVSDADHSGTLTNSPNAVLSDGEAVTKLQRPYLPVIDWTLKRPAVTLLAAVIVFAGTIASYPLMKTNFLGSDEQNAVAVSQTLTPGISLEAQLAQAERVEEALQRVDAVETVQVTIGGGGMGPISGGGDGEISYALTTDSAADQAEVQDQIRAEFDSLDDAGELSIGGGSGGFGMSNTIDVEISAPTQSALAEGTELVVAALRDQSAFSQVDSNLGVSRPTLEVQVDRVATAEAGLSEIAVASMVSARMQPSNIGQLIIDDTSISVYLSQGEPPVDQDEINAMKIDTVLGEKRLDEIATVEVVDGPVTITSINADRSATVAATPAGDDLTVASAAADEALEELKLPNGASVDVGGVLAEQQNAFEQLGLALLAAILIVYVVMVATFKSLLQPLLLLISVPFAATGAILLLVATGIPLGVASLIGVLMLVGIVVTNAIVLIDLVNQLRERGFALKDAVRTGSAHRLRPIIMTALATIFALTPMALGITGKGGFISQPLAIVVIGGLLSSTVLTLVVLPTLYYAVERARERSKTRRIERRHKRSEQVIPAAM